MNGKYKFGLRQIKPIFDQFGTNCYPSVMDILEISCLQVSLVGLNGEQRLNSSTMNALASRYQAKYRCRNCDLAPLLTK